MSDPVVAAAVVMAKGKGPGADCARGGAPRSGVHGVPRPAGDLRNGPAPALEDVVAELKALRGDPEGQAWLRRRLDGLGNESD